MLQANALTTLERMKKQLGIPLDDTSEDFQIEMLISAASDAICEYCKREFHIKEYTDAPLEDDDELRYYPVIEIISDNPGGTTTYRAGWITPQNSTETAQRNLPAAIEYACILYADQLSTVGEGVQSERIGDYSVSFTQDFVNANKGDARPMPPAVLALISPYVVRRAV